MRSRRLLPALAAAALATGAPARAFEWSAHVGAGYGRDDSWAPAAPRSTMPYLDVNVGLSLRGFVYRPGVLAYQGDAGYRRYSYTRPNEPETVVDGLSYALRTTLFGNPRAPLSAQLRAARTDGRHDPGGAALASNNTSQSYGGRITYRQEGRPSLAFAYDRVDTVTRVPLLPDARRSIHFLEASTGHGGSGFSYTATYNTSFSEGTYEADAYDDHRVGVSAHVNVTDRATVQLSDSYYLRLPKVDSPYSPRQEVNAFLAVLSNQQTATNMHRAAYGYTHALQTLPRSTDPAVPSPPDVERASQNLSYSIQHALANHPEWRLGGAFALSLSQSRLGEDERRSTGQSLSGNAWWNRRLSQTATLQLSGTQTIGALQPDDEDPKFGYGTSASARLGRSAGAATYDVSYEAGYASDIAERGTTFRQAARGGARAPLDGGTLSADLTVSTQRHSLPHVGVGGSRTATLGAGFAARRYSASLSGSVSSGVSGASVQTGGGDGLFLPLPYDTHTYALTATLGAALTRRLRSTISGAFSSIDAPDRPMVTQSEVRATLGYEVGALRISVEDRYTITEVTGGTARRNLFFVNAARSFGTRY